MKLENITPVILTWNEEPNLPRCLERLRWAKEVLVLDSGSTDATASIVAGYANSRLLVRPFDNHTTQWNFAVDAVASDWVLSLDADYVLGDGFEEELSMLESVPDSDAFHAKFRYLIYGRPLRACLYPPRAVLFRRDRCRYRQDGHTQLLHVPGRAGLLRTHIDHDDRKPLSRWIVSQDRYALLEVRKLLSLTAGELRLQDRIRRLVVPAPVFVFFYTLIIRGALLDGWQGWFYTFQRTFAELMLSLRLIETRLNPGAE